MMVPKWLVVLLVLSAVYHGIASYCYFKQVLGFETTCGERRGYVEGMRAAAVAMEPHLCK